VQGLQFVIGGQSDYTIEYARRIERRVGEQRDDLEMMLKAALGGSLAHM
jgi:hypothetical protein